MLHSLLEKTVPPKIFGKFHFFREWCQGRVFLILVIANVIHTIFYSLSFMMSFVIIPFHLSSPQDSGRRKTPKATKNKKKKTTNQTIGSSFQLLEENVLSSLVRNSRYSIWETEISNLPLILTPLVCTYPATTHKLQLE